MSAHVSRRPRRPPVHQWGMHGGAQRQHCWLASIHPGCSPAHSIPSHPTSKPSGHQAQKNELKLVLLGNCWPAGSLGVQPTLQEREGCDVQGGIQVGIVILCKAGGEGASHCQVFKSAVPEENQLYALPHRSRHNEGPCRLSGSE